MSKHITNTKFTNAKAKQCTVIETATGYSVTSTSGNAYTVTHGTVWACNCKWGQYRARGTNCGCSHVQAVIKHIAAYDGYTATARATDSAHLKRKTFTHGDGLTFTLRKA